MRKLHWLCGVPLQGRIVFLPEIGGSLAEHAPLPGDARKLPPG